MEEAIKSGRRRIDIELPPGLRLGGIGGVLDPLALSTDELPQERIVQADLDLARYLAVLLRPVERELCIAFRSSMLARTAERVWDSAGGRLLAFGGKGGGKRSAFGTGAGAGTEAEPLRRVMEGGRCGFLVAVAPRGRQLRALEELCDEGAPGSEVCVVLLNARLRARAEGASELRQRLAAAFEPAFHLHLVGSPGSEGILFRAMRPEGVTPWVVARRGLGVSKDGQGERFSALEVSRSSEEPTTAEVMAALGIE